MFITTNIVPGKTPITIMEIQGTLDASNFQELISKAKEIRQKGEHNLLLDLKDMSFMSSAGLVALHSIILLFQDKQPPDPDYGWEAYHSIDRDLDNGLQRYVKLLNPQARIMHTLEISRMNGFFEIYTDKETAIDSFNIDKYSSSEMLESVESSKEIANYKP